MTQRQAVLSVAVLGLVLLPTLALAGGRAPGVTFAHPRSGNHAMHHHHFFPEHHGFPRFAAPVIVANPFFPSVVSADPGYLDSVPLAYGTATPTVTATPTPAPLPSLVEYPTGWYQLRGDGVTAPYAWVWIPKPPPPPPATPPDAPDNDEPTGEPVEPSRSGADFYRWTDDNGGVHLTNRLDSVPERYRARAQSQS
jgi:hypothetical protein